MCTGAVGGAGGLAAAASTTIIVQLPYHVSMEEALTQVSVSMIEVPNATTTAVSGPLFAEVLLVRMGMNLPLLLDVGNVAGGFAQRNVVGGIGRVGYSDGDQLIINLKNNSAATVYYQVAYATETWPTTPDAYQGGCQGWDPFNG